MKIVNRAREVARTLEMSVALHSACASDEMRQQRRANILEMSGAERFVALGIDDFSNKFPTAARSALDASALMLAGLRYAGNGVWSTVYRRDQMVFKILRRTALQSDEDRMLYAKRRNEMVESAMPFLGSIGVSQEYSTGRHPFGGYEVVVATQPYVDGETVDFVRTNTTDLRFDHIDRLCSTGQGLTAAKGLVEATFAMDDHLGMVPDINGTDNFRVDHGGNLKLIDIEPIDKNEHPGPYGLMMQQIEKVGRYISGRYA